MRALAWLRHNGLQLAILAGPFALVALLWSRFPDRIAVHWDFSGRPSGWATKPVALLACPLANVLVAIVMGWIPEWDPRLRLDPDPDSRTEAALGVLRVGVTTLLAFGSALIAAASMGHHLLGGRVAANIGLLVLVLLGNFAGKLNPNYFSRPGPTWAAQTDEDWLAAQRATERTTVFGILVFLSLQFILPEAVVVGGLALFVAAAVLWARAGSRTAPPPPRPPGK